MIGDNLEQYTYDNLMRLALSYVPDTVDKREGSVIFDALAPFCQVLAGAFMELRNFYRDTYALTATGEDLDYRVVESGITRYSATYAIKRADFADSEGLPISVPIGSRFSTVSDTNPIIYQVTDVYSEDGVPVAGAYQLTCETSGIIGNQYTGNLVNITFIQGLASATMSTLIQPARDTETDDELRERYFDGLNQKAFGGNIADYREKVLEIEGVGGVQIYPVWNGGGTVKLSIVDTEYNPATEEFIELVANEIDPENYEGEKGTGLGIAPIGHKVTVTTPTETDIDVSATLTLKSGYQLGQVEDAVKQQISDYLLSLRREWDNADSMNRYSLSVFLARVSSAIINVTGVDNVTNLTLNGEAEDIELPQTGASQSVPVLGEVTLSV